MGKASGEAISKFAVGVTFDYCSPFSSTCKPGWTGVKCTLEAKIGAESDFSADESGDEGMGAGAIVGIIFAVLIVGVIGVGVTLFIKERNAKNAATMKQLGMSNYAPNQTMSMSAPPAFCRGRKLRAYPYYDPTVTKSSAFQQLASASAGSFIVADRDGGDF